MFTVLTAAVSLLLGFEQITPPVRVDMTGNSVCTNFATFAGTLQRQFSSIEFDVDQSPLQNATCVAYIRGSSGTIKVTWRNYDPILPWVGTIWIFDPKFNVAPGYHQFPLQFSLGGGMALPQPVYLAPNGGTAEVTIPFSELPNYVTGGTITFTTDIDQIEGGHQLGPASLPDVYITDAAPSGHNTAPAEEFLYLATHFAETKSGKANVLKSLARGLYHSHAPIFSLAPIIYDPTATPDFVILHGDPEEAGTYWLNYERFTNDFFASNTDRHIDCTETASIMALLGCSMGHPGADTRVLWAQARSSSLYINTIFGSVPGEGFTTTIVYPMGWNLLPNIFEFGYHHVYVNEGTVYDATNGVDFAIDTTYWNGEPAAGYPWLFSSTPFSPAGYWQTIHYYEGDPYYFGFVDSYVLNGQSPETVPPATLPANLEGLGFPFN